MSGGSYDYVSSRFESAAEELERRHAEPHIRALATHLRAIATVMHEIEWADSCDTQWTEAIDASIRALLHPGAELAEAREAAITAARNLWTALGQPDPEPVTPGSGFAVFSEPGPDLEPCGWAWRRGGTTLFNADRSRIPEDEAAIAFPVFRRRQS